MSTSTRKTLTITIDLEGAALSDAWGDQEAAALLTKCARQVDRLHDGAEWKADARWSILDSNGNTVGRMIVAEAPL